MTMKFALDELVELATQLGLLAHSQGKMIATAESCTGGLIAWALTQTAGSSQWFERGFVTYSNAAKEQSIGVSSALIERNGAVSEAVAQAMALGCLNTASQARLALSVTGIAGPSGATADKPVGTVCFGWALRAPQPTAAPTCIVQTLHFTGDRGHIREQAARHSLHALVGFLLQIADTDGLNVNPTEPPADQIPATK